MTSDSEIRYITHYAERVGERPYLESFAETVLQDADAYYYDTLRHRFVAVKRIYVLGAERDVALAYEIEDNATRMVTIHLIKEGQQQNRTQSGRWVPYEPESKL